MQQNLSMNIRHYVTKYGKTVGTEVRLSTNCLHPNTSSSSLGTTALREL
jgi:hypothetical protein